MSWFSRPLLVPLLHLRDESGDGGFALGFHLQHGREERHRRLARLEGISFQTLKKIDFAKEGEAVTAEDPET